MGIRQAGVTPRCLAPRPSGRRRGLPGGGSRAARRGPPRPRCHGASRRAGGDGTRLRAACVAAGRRPWRGPPAPAGARPAARRSAARRGRGPSAARIHRSRPPRTTRGTAAARAALAARTGAPVRERPTPRHAASTRHFRHACHAVTSSLAPAGLRRLVRASPSFREARPFRSRPSRSGAGARAVGFPRRTAEASRATLRRRIRPGRPRAAPRLRGPAPAAPLRPRLPRAGTLAPARRGLHRPGADGDHASRAGRGAERPAAGHHPQAPGAPGAAARGRDDAGRARSRLSRPPPAPDLTARHSIEPHPTAPDRQAPDRTGARPPGPRSPGTWPTGRPPCSPPHARACARARGRTRTRPRESFRPGRPAVAGDRSRS